MIDAAKGSSCRAQNSRAQPFVADDASRRGAAAEQAGRELGAPVPKGREKFDIVVTAGDHEVHAFPVHDVEQSALERFWLGGRGRHPVDDIEIEERGLVRHARRCHEHEPVATAIERGQNILADPGAHREHKQTQAHREVGIAVTGNSTPTSSSSRCTAIAKCSGNRAKLLYLGAGPSLRICWPSPPRDRVGRNPWRDKAGELFRRGADPRPVRRLLMVGVRGFEPPASTSRT